MIFNKTQFEIKTKTNDQMLILRLYIKMINKNFHIHVVLHI